VLQYALLFLASHLRAKISLGQGLRRNRGKKPMILRESGGLLFACAVTRELLCRVKETQRSEFVLARPYLMSPNIVARRKNKSKSAVIHEAIQEYLEKYLRGAGGHPSVLSYIKRRRPTAHRQALRSDRSIDSCGESQCLSSA